MEYWKKFYPDAVKAHPSKKLELLGETVTVQVYVDVKHAGNLANTRSHSGILIYFINALINFYSKRQDTVKS